MAEKELEKTLTMTKNALLFNGVKILRNLNLNKAIDSFIDNYLYYCNFTILYTVLFGETYWLMDGIRTNKPFLELSLISPCITISVLGTVKSGNLYLNKETLIEVVEKLKEIHPMFDDNEAEEFIEIERKIKKDSMKMLRFVQLLILSLFVVVVTAFCLTPVLLAGYNYHKSGEFVIVYPYFIKYMYFDAYDTSFWPLIYIHQVWATIIVTSSMFGGDTLLFALCVYINMHFHLLGLRFENVVSACENETRKKLAKAVLAHQELINLVDQSEVLFSKSSLLNIVLSSILICLSAFNISVTDDISIMIAFVTFLLMSLSQISMVCYFADLLMKSSMEINDFVYNCSWYEADEVSKKTLLLVMLRSQKPCRLTAWKFVVLNLGTLTTILGRSWSYFALLKTVYK